MSITAPHLRVNLPIHPAWPVISGYPHALTPPDMHLGWALQGGIPAGISSGFTRGSVRRINRTGDGQLVTLSSNQLFSDNDPVTGRPIGLPVEAAKAANLNLHPEDLGTTWLPSNASISTNAILAPDGNLTADKIVENGADSSHGASYTGAYTSGTKMTLVTYVQSGERTTARLSSGGTGMAAEVQAWFDVTNVTVGTESNSPEAKITDEGGGWRRISISFTPNSTTTGIYLLRMATGDANATYQGDSASGMYFWGIDLSPVPFPTSYNALAARSADLPTVTDAALFGSPTWSIIVDIEPMPGAVAAGLGRFTISDGGTTNRMTMYNSSGSLFIVVAAGGVEQFNENIGTYPVARARLGVSFDGTNYKSYLNGSLLSTDAGDAMTDPDQYDIGHAFGSGQSANWQRQSLFWKYALSEQDMLVRTTI